jgi:hypothetical protein
VLGGELPSDLGHLVAVGQLGRDALRFSVLRQRFDRGPDPVLVSARDHGGAAPGDHLVGRGRAHAAAAAADDHDLTALEAHP